MDYQMKWVRDHVEVTVGGRFCFSADNEGEALAELQAQAAA